LGDWVVIRYHLCFVDFLGGIRIIIGLGIAPFFRHRSNSAPKEIPINTIHFNFRLAIALKKFACVKNYFQ
jgi:hypothetical protein